MDFYEQMLKILSEKGLNRNLYQTPSEFAYDVKIQEVATITEKYNRVRYGKQSLIDEERNEIKALLEKLKTADL